MSQQGIRNLDDGQTPFWAEYLNILVRKGLFSVHHISCVTSLRGKLERAIGKALPDPITQDAEDGALQMCWNYERRLMEIDVYEDGRYQWFFKNRETGEVAGSEEPLHDLLFEVVRWMKETEEAKP
jgi:hypothetical protein